MAFIALFVNGVASYLIARFLGRKRVMGFGWSFFFSFFTSFLFGFIIVMMSPKYKNAQLKKSLVSKVIGITFLCLGGLLLFGAFVGISNGDVEVLNVIGFAVAIFGGGIYLIMRSNGASFHTKGLVEV